MCGIESGEQALEKEKKSSFVPLTSVTLLRDLATDSQHARWGEFVYRYRPMMEAYMRTNFRDLDCDEVIQETLIALIRVFPVYHYVPEENRHFHNYLTGILRNKAANLCRLNRRRREVYEDYASNLSKQSDTERRREEEERVWRKSVYEIALQQLLADESVQERTKQIFVRVVINAESPEAVARSFGMTRNAVDQIKNRMKKQLRKLVEALEKVDHS